MINAFVIIFGIVFIFLAHKLYNEYKIMMMRKKWNSCLIHGCPLPPVSKT